jgi:class 3 adenylate cyclase
MGAPITGRDYQPGGRVGTPAPTTELVSREVYAVGLTNEIVDLGVPAIAWHLTQLDLAEALNAKGLMQHALTVDRWLKHKPPQANQPAALYRVKPNRHGRLTLRLNTDHAPREVAAVFLAAVEAATITVPDPLDVADLLAEWDRISPETVFALAGAAA